MVQKSNWSPVEDHFLLQNHGHFSKKQLAKNLSKSVNAINKRLAKLLAENPKGQLKVCANPLCAMFFRAKGNQKYCKQQCSVNRKLHHSLVLNYFEDHSFEELVEKFELSPSKASGILREHGIKLIGDDRTNAYQATPGGSSFVDGMVDDTPKGTYAAGYRKDLGVAVRSRWEANVLRWLNHMGKTWEFEPQVFYFDERRGATSYLPDIKMRFRNTYKWIEVKGRMDSRSKTKTRRFKKFYPNEFNKLSCIVKNERVDAAKFYESMGVPVYAYYDEIRQKYADSIPNWE